MQTPPVLTDLVDTCLAAVNGDSVHETIHRALRNLIADPAVLAAQIPRFAPGEVETSARGFRLGGEHVVHRDQDLTVMVLDTLAGVIQPPHEHRMVAYIGVFEGAEEQRFWSRDTTGIQSAPGKTLEAGETLALGESAIHAISAPVDRPSRAVHIYLGDIYDVERSVFNPETLAEHPMTDERYDEFCRFAAEAR